MHFTNKQKSWGLIFGILTFVLLSCTPLISPFSEQAYQNATSLKAQSLALIAKSGEPFETHKDTVAKVILDADIAYEYAKGLPQNQETTSQWDKLRDKNGNLLGGFARMWKQKGVLSDYFKSQTSEQIEKAFDTIICLEINKKTSISC